MPIVSFSLILACFSVAGMPLLAGFPVHFSLWSKLTVTSPITAVFTLLGSVGLLVSGIRTLAVLTMGQDEAGWSIQESRSHIIILTSGVFFLFLIGLFPQVIFPAVTSVSQIFTHLLTWQVP
jgi:formate hydrogenlyase subunit 3/multisubunit Na+/H+ antiporter MnhD subunit